MLTKYTPTITLVLIFQSAIAQPNKDTLQHLPEVAIASPFSNSIASPLTISNIGKTELQRKNYGQEPSMLLAQTPSVTWYTDAGSSNGYSYFRIRGIDQTRINMSLNGVPLNEPEDQGVFFSNYPDFLQSISGIQIQRGTGYSKNGVASYGGSLYFESLPFKDSTGGQLSANYGSFNTYRINGSVNTGLHNDIGLYARGSYLHSDGYKDHSGNTSGSAYISTGYWGSRHKLYIISFIGNQQNDLAWLGSPMDSISKNSRYNADKNESDNFTQAHVQLHHEWQIANNQQLHTGVFYNYLKGNYDFDLNNFLGLPSTSEMYNYAFRSNFTGAFSYYSITSKHIKWYNGVQAQWYNRRHTGSERTAGKLYVNTGYRNESSVFSKLAANAGKWTLLGDIQYRYSSFTYQGNEAMPGQYWNFLNTTAGISYALNNQWQLYYSLGQTHREPTRSDLFIGNDDLARDTGGELLFNPVKPERVTDHELGVKYFHTRGHLYTNLYYMNFHNEITLNGQIGPSGVPLHSNAASSFRSGLELDAAWQFHNGIVLRNQSAVSANRIRENGIHLQPVLTPAFISNQEIRYVKPHWQAGVTVRYQAHSYIDYANTIKLPGYFIAGVDASRQFRKFTFFGILNNVTNKKYFNNGVITATGVPGYFIQAPLNFMIGVKYQW
ncbi:MAG: TonB-dependent receptor [Chitinophagaceae bacterium]